MTDANDFTRIRAALASGRRFLLTSHARPDGDSLGSQIALALALEALGKTVRIVNRDPVPGPYRAFPAIDRIEVAGSADGEFDAAIVLECGDITRPGVAGLERFFVINVDHHVGNTGYGALNWYDPSAAACGEMVLDLIDALGAPLSRDIATHLYVAVLTDTGSFRHANITARSFELCRRAADAGVDAADVARRVFDSSHAGKLKLMGALLDGMRLEANGQLAVLYLDDAILARTGTNREDLEGLVNLPFAAREIRAVLFFKVEGPGDIRVSLRSKGDVDVRAVATRFDGGGHVNAAGFSVRGRFDQVRDGLVRDVAAAIAAADTRNEHGTNAERSRNEHGPAAGSR
jgi:phosphoesterase RecJ-like protein